MRAAILNGSNVVVRVVMLDSLSQIPGSINGTGADVGDTWDGATFVRPQKTLAQAKRDARQAVRLRWAEEERKPFSYAGKSYDSSTENLTRITVLGLRAMRAKEDGEPFSAVLLESDETMDVAGRPALLDLAKAAGDIMAARGQRARAIVQLINACTIDAAEVNAVKAAQLDVGWP